MINKLVFFSMSCDHCGRRLIGRGNTAVTTQDFAKLSAASKEAGWKLADGPEGQKLNFCPVCQKKMAAGKAS